MTEILANFRFEKLQRIFSLFAGSSEVSRPSLELVVSSLGGAHLMPPEGCGGSRVSLFLGLKSASSLVPGDWGEMPWFSGLRVFARRHSQWWGEG